MQPELNRAVVKHGGGADRRANIEANNSRRCSVALAPFRKLVRRRGQPMDVVTRQALLGAQAKWVDVRFVNLGRQQWVDGGCGAQKLAMCECHLDIMPIRRCSIRARRAYRL